MKKNYLKAYTCLVLLAGSLLLSSCWKLRGHYGGPKSFEPVPRSIQPADIALPAGYKIEAIAQGLNYPTAITFDDSGNIYVTEAGYAYGEIWTQARLLRIEPDGKTTQVAEGGKNGPWSGLSFYQGNFYVSEGGTLEKGRILRITPNGAITPVIQDLPTGGDHFTTGPVIGPDGNIYFGLGTYTNSGVVGLDNYRYGWLKRNPQLHDIPCRDITLAGQNFITDNPLTPDPKDKATTGAYVPFGTPTTSGQVIKGSLPCSGAILRMPVTGGNLELVAWGLRNPFGLAFAPNNTLYVTDNAYDVRGSRPIYGAGDVLWAINQGPTWYGWPDYSEGKPLNTSDYETNKQDPRFVLANHPNKPPKPAAILGVHSSANSLDFSRNTAFGHVGEAFIAEFGDQAPEVGRIYGPVGYKVVRVNTSNGVVEDFAVNKGRTNGPASMHKSGGLERPIAARFDPKGEALYVVDFGVMPITEQGEAPKQKTGVVWKITKEATR
ncbi:PQQ-dependent sugar dehydrogenase [Adhaeribacter aquaticus]|uniref:PQQ-dependent sugar dehydrogenase n=1 Tax=Adhaeribacter aquaticus TaxID=299567 RepID=UPI00047E73E9|nr:glucose dehydrogenase [Adhaeribacter aquaticus]